MALVAATPNEKACPMTAASPFHHYRLLATVGALYVAQGIPLGLAMETLPTLLRQDGASLTGLAFLPLVGLPWIVKFLWAPFVDNHWSRRIGKRRSWIIPMQASVFLCLTAVAILGIGDATTPIAIALFALASLASATQDTATDGLGAENFEGAMLVRANAVQVGGTMIGFFIGGAGCLILAGMLGRQAALAAMALIVLSGLVLILLWREPAPAAQSTTRPEHASLSRFVRRPGAVSVLAIALLTAVTASSVFGLSKLFLVDRGWALEAIGQIGMIGGVVTVVVGCGGGAWLVRRMGIARVLLLSLCLSSAGACLWIMQASAILPVERPIALAAILLGSVGSGGASVAAMTLAMRFAARARQAGTDMTAVQSSRDLGEIGTSATVTAIAGVAGYSSGFAVGIVAAIAAIFVILSFRHNEALRQLADQSSYCG